MDKYIRYISGLLLILMGSGLPALAQDEYNPDNPSDPGDPGKMLSYEITVSVNDSLAGIVSGAGTYKYGRTITVNTSANAGYKFLYWLKDGTQCATTTSFTYTVETKNVAFTAVYEKIVPVTPVDPGSGGESGESGDSGSDSGDSGSGSGDSGSGDSGSGSGDSGSGSGGDGGGSGTETPDIPVYYNPTNPAEPLMPDFPEKEDTDDSGGTSGGEGGQTGGETGGETGGDEGGGQEDPQPEVEVVYHKLKLVPSPKGSCTFSIASGLLVAEEGVYSVTVTPGTDQDFVGWYVDGKQVSKSLTYSTYMGTKDVTLTAVCNYNPASPDEPFNNLPNVIKGDVNMDGYVNIEDVVELSVRLLKGTAVLLDPAIADMNEDGEVNMTDLVALSVYCMKHK